MVLLLVLTLVVLTVAAFAAGYALARRRETGTDALRQLRDGTSAA